MIKVQGVDRLIRESVAAEILNISPDTLRRLAKRGEGPPRRQVSPRRVAYKLSEVECYRDGGVDTKGGLIRTVSARPKKQQGHWLSGEFDEDD